MNSHQSRPRAAVLAVLGGLVVATVRPSSAQEAPATRPGPAATTSGVPTTPPSTQPGVAAATRPVATSVSLDFKNAPLDAVLDHLSEAAGFVVVKEAAVDGRVTVVSRQPLSPDEAVTLLNAVLKTNGFTAIRTGRVLKVTARDAAKKANVPVHFGADPAAIEPSDELRTQVIPVGNIDAVKLRQDLAPVLGTDADVAANGGSNALIVTDTAANVRRVVQIVGALDRHEPGNAELRRYPLQHADAAAAARLVTTLMRPPDAQPGAQKQPQKEGAEQPLRGRVTAVADDRTNTLFVAAQSATLEVVDGIMRDLESNPTAAAEIKIFSPKFADAASAARLITAVFRPEDAQPRRDGEQRPPRDPNEALRARVTAAADERTNTLVVTAPAATLRIVDEILQRLDADPTSTSEIRVFPLTYADAASAARLVGTVFRPADAPPNPNEPRRRDGADAAVNARVTAAADERTNSLVVTAPTETVKVIERVLQVLDTNPAAASAVKVVQLKNADAASAVFLLNTIFGPDPARAGGTAAPPPPPATGQPAAPARGRLSAASDTRTNAVVLQAPAELMAAAEVVLKELDANPTTEETLFIYRLRNGQAARMEYVLNALFGNTTPGAGGAGLLGRLAGGLGSSDPLRGGRGSGLDRLLGRSGGGGGPGSSRGGGGFGLDGLLGGGLDPRLGGRGGLQGIANSLPQNLTAGTSRAITELTGQVFVVADEDTNALLVTTATKYLDQVKQVIAELDRPVPQVLIKVLVAEVTHDDSADFGLDFSVINRRPNGQGTSVSSAFGNASATTGLVVSLLEDKLNATLHALRASGKLEVLSRPYILASDNQLASITVGNEVPFVTNTRITDQGQQINTIEYQDVGIILSVTPHINPDGLVIMDVTPEISQLTSSSVSVSDGVTAPVIAKRAASSRVGIQTGNTIVIGGLMEDRKTSTVSKVPLLGDIPLVGAIFSRTLVSKTKTELLIFLTPHVAQQPDDLDAMTRDEAAGTSLTPKAVQPGMFQEHMDGMRRGATAPQGGATRPAGSLEVPIRPAFGPATSPAVVPGTVVPSNVRP